MNSDNLKLISNKKIIIKKSISPNGFIFLQETHSSVDDEKRWCTSLMAIYIFLTEKLIRTV